jgi:ribosomal-protein-alanine N-acetyltransferase
MYADIRLRRMTLKDLDAVEALERLCFPDPWPRNAFERELTVNRRLARYLVLTWQGKPIAYAGVWLVEDEGHITNIAVHPDFRGRGCGERITRALMRMAADLGITWMTLEVRRGNAVAQKMYHKLGFVDVGYRKRYYEYNHEDALVMACEDLEEVVRKMEGPAV